MLFDYNIDLTAIGNRSMPNMDDEHCCSITCIINIFVKRHRQSYRGAVHSVNPLFDWHRGSDLRLGFCFALLCIWQHTACASRTVG